MQDLTAVGVSPDGQRLLLVDDDGTEYAVPLDASLRTLVGGTPRRPARPSPGPTQGHLEIKMESALRPRDIQARIRAGETPEAVASAAGTTVDSIMSFAMPVLAERAHIAQTARKASVRRRTNETGAGARTLGETADLFFASHTLHDEDVEWDAWRRADGRWALVAAFSIDGRERTAEFTHDLSGRYVVAENDEARLLTGELRDSSTPAAAAAPVQRDRRLSSVPSQDALPLGDDALEMVRDQEPAAASSTPEIPEAVLDVDTAVDTAVDTDAEETVEVREDPVAETVEAPAAEEPATEEPAAEEKSSRRKGRSSVPSWDEIMFGGGSAD